MEHFNFVVKNAGDVLLQSLQQHLRSYAHTLSPEDYDEMCTTYLTYKHLFYKDDDIQYFTDHNYHHITYQHFQQQENDMVRWGTLASQGNLAQYQNLQAIQRIDAGQYLYAGAGGAGGPISSYAVQNNNQLANGGPASGVCEGLVHYIINGR